MATLSNNTTIKFASRISFRSVVDGAWSYTVPANSYLEGYIVNNTLSTGIIAIVDLMDIYVPLGSGSTGLNVVKVVIPAGSTIQSASGSVGHNFFGTLFTNTP